MSEHTATVIWRRGDQVFTDDSYSRGHQWQFDGGATIDASASPEVVPLPMSVPEYIDPEEAFIAALASCHMLFFLSLAAHRKYVVDSYTDAAIGYMGKNEKGRIWMTKVILEPKVSFVGDRVPTSEELEKLHHRAHELCFIANSVRTEVITRVTS
ncbi:MAG TPA: OsmC family protein [Woeseiaceae bacterium]|jgi:organic hydroperoxide reductase OsmC/OhrA|nr:OsmC family protein [Woeseiaceae bacterium]